MHCLDCVHWKQLPDPNSTYGGCWSAESRSSGWLINASDGCEAGEPKRESPSEVTKAERRDLLVARLRARKDTPEAARERARSGRRRGG